MDENLIPGFSLVPESLVEKDEQENISIPGFSPIKPDGDVEKPKVVATKTPAPAATKEDQAGSGDSQSEELGSDLSDQPEIKKADTQFQKDFKYFDLDNIRETIGSKTGNIEEIMEKDLMKTFSKWGFVFEQSGAGDYITVTTTDPDNIQSQEFSVGSFLTGNLDEEG